MTDWITAIASAITALSLAFVIFQVHIQRRQIKEDHERSRRATAIDLLFRWFNSLDQKISLARVFAETLSEESLRAIFNNEAFCLDDNAKIMETLAILLDVQESDIKKEDGHIKISKQWSGKLRWQIIEYLNILEGIVAAWVYNVADRELIESEFKYLFCHHGGALKKFREVSGNAFPCIDLFEIKMIEKTKSHLGEKYKLGG